MALNDVETAIAAADAGAEVVRHRFGTALVKTDKGRGDFATNADIEAEQAMLSLLMRERPEDAVLAEETGRSGAADAERTWLIDPLCGTLNYAARMQVAGVNVALRAGRRFLAAAVADPFTGEIFYTDGASAFRRSNGEDRPLARDGASRMVDLNLDPPFPNGAAFTAASLAADAGFRSRFRPRVVSTSIALTWVASGQRAAYLSDGDVRDSVHFSAGLAICESAGCVVTDLWGERWGEGPTGLVASADPKTHTSLMELIGNQLSNAPRPTRSG